MKRPNQKWKSPISQRKAIDSVSAIQLLKALHTLQNIHIVQQQVSHDLNISFSQNNNFDQTSQISQKSLNLSQAQSTSQLKVKKNKDNQKKLQKREQSKTGKMNFEFYMTKKQTNENKHKSKSSHPIQTTKVGEINRTLQKCYTPKKNTVNVTVQSIKKVQSIKQYIIPLTQRSLNSSIIGKSLRMKTQVNQNHLNSKSKQVKNNHAINNAKNSKKVIRMNKQNKNQLGIDNSIKPDKELDNHKINHTINQLSMHERNKQFMRQKNEKIAKLAQQIQEKKKQQEKQCTFKPKIISNNTNIKSKYNDLCASRQFYEKSHKRCRTGKENNCNYYAEDQFDPKIRNLKTQKNIKNSMQEKQKLLQHMNFTTKSMLQQCNFQLDESSSMNEQDELQNLKAKTKYKNAKFNILLDLIH